MTNTAKPKPIRITNSKAIQLVEERATKEGRSLANAASQSIIERLDRPKRKDTK